MSKCLSTARKGKKEKERETVCLRTAKLSSPESTSALRRHGYRVPFTPLPVFPVNSPSSGDARGASRRVRLFSVSFVRRARLGCLRDYLSPRRFSLARRRVFSRRRQPISADNPQPHLVASRPLAAERERKIRAEESSCEFLRDGASSFRGRGLHTQPSRFNCS